MSGRTVGTAALWAVALGALLLLGAAAHRGAARDYRRGAVLTRGVVAAAWAAYLGHAALVGYAAWRAVWPIALPRAVTLTGGGVLVLAGLGVYRAGSRAFGPARA